MLSIELRLTSILLLFLLSNSPFSKAQDEGSACNAGDSAGVCKLLKECPSVYKELEKGKLPHTTCGFHNFDSIVCCPTTVTDINTRKKGNKAKQKCEEYSSYVFTTEFPPVLTVKQTYLNVSQCAIHTKKLIVGGKKANPKEFPHMVAIGYGDLIDSVSWLCGGSLISEKFVLTAAHCTWHQEWGTANWVRVGDLNLERTDEDASPQDVRVVERINHPEYNLSSKYHDIALLKLGKDVTLNKWVRPCCLPYSSPDIGDNTKATATGWGQVEWSGDQSKDLLKIVINLIPHQQCNSEFTGGGNDYGLEVGIVDDRQICAGASGMDTCQGDSGGPLVVENKDYYCMYSLIGVTSLGKLCGSITPGIYTRVYTYLSWIENIVWPDS